MVRLLVKTAKAQQVLKITPWMVWKRLHKAILKMKMKMKMEVSVGELNK
jgi:hypothetical protein